MKSPITIFTKLYLPLIFSLIILCAAYYLRLDENGAHITLDPLGGLFSFNMPIHSEAFARCIALGLAMLMLLTQLFIDYSSIFPQHLKMEVFYDTEGIEHAIRSLGYFGRKLQIPPNSDAVRAQYYRDVNGDVATAVGAADFFGPGVELHSQGKTSFIVEKLPGLQKYRLAESEGEVTHILERPRVPPVSLTTLFQRLPSGSDYIEMSLLDVIIGRGILLMPTFKQLLAEDRRTQSTIFRATTIGVTVIKIFPWPHVSPTIYFTKSDNHYIPLAYAEYL